MYVGIYVTIVYELYMQSNPVQVLVKDPESMMNNFKELLE